MDKQSDFIGACSSEIGNTVPNPGSAGFYALVLGLLES
jgi:hypothetical protein